MLESRTRWNRAGLTNTPLDAGAPRNVTRLRGETGVLASRESGWMTGAAIPLDSGLSAY